MNVHDEFTRRVAADRLCRELARAIAENDTAALERLGMRGFGLYAGRLSELMTDSVRRELLGTDDFAGTDFGAIMGEVAKPAHYAHHLVNEGGSAIQQALDRRNGVRLRVVEPEFNDGRLKGIVGQIAESDSENAADNLATQLGTFVKDMGNEFMRQNAEQRDRAGFKVTVTRTGGAKCCPWCADRTGKWELANAPDGVFGCHDNCKCMVDYTNSKGTVRGRASGKKWNFSEIPYEPPRVLTKEEAAERGGFDKPKRLTNGEKHGIISINIDELVPCLRDNQTGELVETEVRRVRNFSELRECTPRNGWDFPWNKPPRDSEVYALSVAGNKEIEGLIALRIEPRNQAVYMYWGNAAPHNQTTESNPVKKYNGVGGHLFAIAIHRSLQSNFGGYVYADAANKDLLKHFTNRHGAFAIPTHDRPYRFIIEGKAAKTIFETYNFDWR